MLTFPVLTIPKPRDWGVGGSLTTAGFTFGVGYAERNDPRDRRRRRYSRRPGGLELGVAYDLAGPWTVGLEGYFGEEDTAGSDAKYEAYKLAGSRSLGSGVSWDVYYTYVNRRTGGEVEGNVIATAINLSF